MIVNRQMREARNILRTRADVVWCVGVEATERVRRRLRELADDRRFNQTKVAARLGIDQSNVNRYVRGATPITISFLEAISGETGIPLAELVAPPGTIHELHADEAALIRWLRRWPISVTRSLARFLAFFADEPSEVLQTRNQHELWRGMAQKDRDWYQAIGVMLREGLPDEARASIVAQAEARAARDAAHAAPSLDAVEGLAEVIAGPRRDAPPRQSGAPAKSVSTPARGSDRTAEPRRRTVREKR